jgi:hypothetical protein
VIYTTSHADTIAAATEGLMRCANMLDREANATFDPAKLEDLAAKRIQIEATARMIEGLLDDGGTFNAAMWEPDALRAYVECELAADDGGRVAADAAVAPTGGTVPLWLE